MKIPKLVVAVSEYNALSIPDAANKKDICLSPFYVALRKGFLMLSCIP